MIFNRQFVTGQTNDNHIKYLLVVKDKGHIYTMIIFVTSCKLQTPLLMYW